MNRIEEAGRSIGYGKRRGRVPRSLVFNMANTCGWVVFKTEVCNCAEPHDLTVTACGTGPNSARRTFFDCLRQTVLHLRSEKRMICENIWLTVTVQEVQSMRMLSV